MKYLLLCFLLVLPSCTKWEESKKIKSLCPKTDLYSLNTRNNTMHVVYDCTGIDIHNDKTPN